MATIASASVLPVRLFGEGIAATGVDAQLSMRAERIEIDSEHHTSSCAFADLQIREVGFGGAMGFELAWQEAGKSYAVHVLQSDAVGRLSAHPHFAALDDVKRLTSHQRTRCVVRTFALLIVAVIVLLPLLVVLVFVWQADRIVASLIDRVSIEQEVSLGDAAFASMRPSLKLIDDSPSLDAVRMLGEPLVSTSKYTYRFHLADDASINAFALPGGIIIVHTGLIAATRRPEELSGVLAHEIQHVEQRHSLRGAIKELGLRGVWAWVTGDIGGTLAGHAALELTSRKFSRDDESDADQGAFQMLVAHRIDPTAMADFFTTMSQQADAQVPEFLSTHPASVERRRKLMELSQRYGGRFEALPSERWPPSSTLSLGVER